MIVGGGCKNCFLSRGFAATILQLLSGRVNRLSLKLARLSGHLTYVSFARFSPAEYKAILSRNKELAGTLAGRRAFVVATGPSMLQIDLRRLHSEFVIAVNENFELLAKAGTRVSTIIVVDPGIRLGSTNIRAC